MTDYTVLAYENMIKTLPLEQEICEAALIAESEFILSCLESGHMRSVMEAKEQGKLRQLWESIKEFLNKIVSIFIKKAADYALKYRQWAVDNEAVFKKKALDIELKFHTKSFFN